MHKKRPGKELRRHNAKGRNMKQQRVKFGKDELMECVDVFNVPKDVQAKFREMLDALDQEPDAGKFFRYHNDRSKVVEFEQRFAEKMGVPYVLAVNSGTSALIAAMIAAGVGPGDEVIVPAYTFFASVSAIVVAQAIPVIVEIDESLTISPEAIEKAITPQTKAIIAVHMIGLNCKMDKITEIAKKHNLAVIEDTAQACGGRYKGQYLGTWGDLGCISLDAFKVIASGEGGVVMCKDEFMYIRAQSWHDTAACWRPNRFARERREGELFCGENYRMSELEGAVALAQLRKLDWINDTCRKTWNRIREEVKLPAGVKWVEPNDPSGVCGYQAPMLFEDQEYAVRLQNAKIGLGGNARNETQGVRNWHMAWYWEHIIEKKASNAAGYPFTIPLVKHPVNYTVDSWPETKRIISHMCTIAGITPFLTEEEIKAKIEKINNGFKTV